MAFVTRWMTWSEAKGTLGLTTDAVLDRLVAMGVETMVNAITGELLILRAPVIELLRNVQIERRRAITGVRYD